MNTRNENTLWAVLMEDALFKENRKLFTDLRNFYGHIDLFVAAEAHRHIYLNSPRHMISTALGKSYVRNWRAGEFFDSYFQFFFYSYRYSPRRAALC